MIVLIAATVLVALLVGYRANAKSFIVASAAVLVATLLLLYPHHEGLGLIGRIAANVAIFEITAICAMLFLAPARHEVASKPQGADDGAGHL